MFSTDVHTHTQKKLHCSKTVIFLGNSNYRSHRQLGGSSKKPVLVIPAHPMDKSTTRGLWRWLKEFPSKCSSTHCCLATWGHQAALWTLPCSWRRSWWMLIQEESAINTWWNLQWCVLSCGPNIITCKY